MSWVGRLSTSSMLRASSVSRTFAATSSTTRSTHSSGKWTGSNTANIEGCRDGFACRCSPQLPHGRAPSIPGSEHVSIAAVGPVYRGNRAAASGPVPRATDTIDRRGAGDARLWPRATHQETRKGPNPLPPARESPGSSPCGRWSYRQPPRPAMSALRCPEPSMPWKTPRSVRPRRRHPHRSTHRPLLRPLRDADRTLSTRRGRAQSLLDAAGQALFRLLASFRSFNFDKFAPPTLCLKSALGTISRMPLDTPFRDASLRPAAPAQRTSADEDRAFVKPGDFGWRICRRLAEVGHHIGSCSRRP